VHAWVLVAVLVYAPGNGGAKRAEVQAALEKAAGDVDVHALRGAIADRAAGWVRAAELAFFERARAKAEEGRRLLDRVELDAADTAFAEAERIYERNLAWPGVPVLWSQVALWHGVTAFERGQPQAAKKLFQRAAVLDPSVRLTEANARPDVVRAFAESQKPRPPVPLTVKGEAQVDGQPPPAQIAAGEHVVSRRGVAALIDAEGPTEIELVPADDPVLADLESLQHTPNAAGARALAVTRGLDAVYVAAVGLDAGALTLVGEKLDGAGCATPPATVVLHGAALDVAAASLIERLQRARPTCPSEPEAVVAASAIAHPRPAPVPIAPPLQAPRKKKIWERPWIWMGLLAVSVVSIGLAAGLTTTQTSYRANVDGSAFTR
jgi:hypothetical protein